jgi:hypothetical protein
MLSICHAHLGNSWAPRWRETGAEIIGARPQCAAVSGAGSGSIGCTKGQRKALEPPVIWRKLRMESSETPAFAAEWMIDRLFDSLSDRQRERRRPALLLELLFVL